MWSNKIINQNINYIHQNHIEAELVFRAEEYRYSNAIDYSDEKGLLDGVVVFRMKTTTPKKFMWQRGLKEQLFTIDAVYSCKF
ncbi:hypothetical protein [Chryseobacterium aquaticum]|uniref:hypothetical protein n=1 Tax=Chryseobacterium aquaticum TaxID=452084 RepID=UPI001E48CAC9|nr:hypothetical protein [Chryseobacterium aquaticum]